MQLLPEVELSPVRSLVSEAVKTACGAEFTVWLTKTEGASILYGLCTWFLFYYFSNKKSGREGKPFKLLFIDAYNSRSCIIFYVELLVFHSMVSLVMALTMRYD